MAFARISHRIKFYQYVGFSNTIEVGLSAKQQDVMIGVDFFYFWSWKQYASCISTLKVGCRQPISRLRLMNVQENMVSERERVVDISVKQGSDWIWTVCKIARCHGWWRHCLPLIMESIHILQKYVESRMQTVYHSIAFGKNLSFGNRDC